MEKKQGWMRRLNEWLDEAPGEQFKDGKWRFWLPALILFGLMNAIMTAVIFSSDENWRAYVGVMMLSAGAAVGWIGVGALHYSDSTDSRTARGVALLDSITLVFVVIHFCFLMWVQGHLWTLQKADAKYETALAAYNAQAGKVSGDNVEIARAAERIAEQTTKAEKLRNDTAYQTRKAAEAGAVLPGRRVGPAIGGSPALSTSQVVLKEPEKPKESATDFLTRWDAWIRFANFGEIGLAIFTMIFIRNMTAKTNTRARPSSARSASGSAPGDEFPDELDDMEIVQRSDRPRPSLRQNDRRIAAVATDEMGPDGRNSSVATAGSDSEITRLREHLRAIAFYHPGRWFKVDPIAGGVLIRFCERQEGREVEIARTRQSNKILAAVDRPDFPARLKKELIHCGFPLQ